MTFATRQRSSYRAFAVTVAERAALSPNFTRLTLTGDDLDLCGDTCLDQRLRLIFAPAQMVEQVTSRFDPDFDWYGWWLQLAQDDRPPMRTFTARAVRQHLREVDIDFACHGHQGPASRFALTARTGDRLLLVGPDRDAPRSTAHGVTWRPGNATEVLLAGDETAVPAICGILESLPAHVGGNAFLEVVDSGDIQPVNTASQVQVTWLPRAGRAVGSRLTDAVHSWADMGLRCGVVDPYQPPSKPVENLIRHEADAGTPGMPYVWLAGEAAVIASLRRYLADRVGPNKRTLSFMGYWKLGRAAQG